MLAMVSSVVDAGAYIIHATESEPHYDPEGLEQPCAGLVKNIAALAKQQIHLFVFKMVRFISIQLVIHIVQLVLVNRW